MRRFEHAFAIVFGRDEVHDFADLAQHLAFVFERVAGGSGRSIGQQVGLFVMNADLDRRMTRVEVDRRSAHPLFDVGIASSNTVAPMRTWTEAPGERLITLCPLALVPFVLPRSSMNNVSPSRTRRA